MYTYVIADTHFNHANIIRYCHRPFTDVNDMNRCLVSNWNKVVKDGDLVFFLGDWGMNSGEYPLKHWIEQLNGNIVNIKGSHDHRIDAILSQKLVFRGIKYLLIHNPMMAYGKGFDWLIHGHLHNNDIINYPFINYSKKTINVSVELINYRPISIEALLENCNGM